MDLAYTPEEEAFRKEARAFVRDNLAESTRCKVANGLKLGKHDYVAAILLLFVGVSVIHVGAELARLALVERE